MTNQVSIYKFENKAEIRVLSVNEAPWFVAVDVCRALNLAEHPMGGFGHHLKGLADDEVTPISKLGVKLPGKGMGNARAVAESGLYKLIMRSDKPEARRFQDWVTRDVLPAIRKDGAYIMGEEKVATGELDETLFVLRAMEILKTKVDRLTEERDALQHKVDHLSVREWEIETGRYCRGQSEKNRLSNVAKTYCIERGLPITRREMSFTDRFGVAHDSYTNVYPREALEYADRMVRAA
ncbi:TPA: hypothetical protein N2A14_002601 [Pseudomonas aeruginosa]|nr:hypothetical protein [Pseudomonas aeruginosa]